MSMCERVSSPLAWSLAWSKNVYHKWKSWVGSSICHPYEKGNTQYWSSYISSNAVGNGTDKTNFSIYFIQL